MNGAVAMKVSMRTKLLNSVCIALFLSAGLVRLVRNNFPQISSNVVIFALFAVACAIWTAQIRQRLLRREERKYITATAYAALFMMLLRTIKFEFLPEESAAMRYAWYLYYVPQTLMALWMFFAVLHIGKHGDKPINEKWKFLYIPAVLIIAGVLTNDLHELAFRFPADAVVKTDAANYVRGPFYYIAVFWLFALFASMVVISFSRCAVSVYKKKIWIPLIPLAAGLTYTVCYIVGDNVLSRLFKFSEVICFLFPAFIEALIITGLFPSNDNHGALWSASSLGGGIMDNNGIVRYRSKSCLDVSEEQVKEAQTVGVPVAGENILLKSHRIHGGYGFWFRDISEINETKKELEEFGDVLEQERAILEEEKRVKEENAKVEQQTLIYKEIAQGSQAQIKELKKILDTVPKNEDEFERAMKNAAVRNVFIKRHSNMILKLRENKVFSGDELRFAVAESIEYIKLCGITAHAEYTGDCKISGKKVLAAYETFENIIEKALPSVSAVLVNIDFNNGIKVSTEAANPASYFCKTDAEAIFSLGGSAEIEAEDGAEYISFALPKGGDAE